MSHIGSSVDLWRKRFSHNELGSSNPSPSYYAAALFDVFVRQVQESQVRLDAPPQSLKPFSVDGGRSLQNIGRCIAQATDKDGQMQAIGDVPESPELITSMFAGGMRFADKNAVYAGKLLAAPRESLRTAISYGKAKAAATALLATIPANCRLSMRVYRALFKELDTSTTHQPEDARAELVRLAVLGTLDGRQGSPLALLTWAQRVHNEVGELAYLALFSSEHCDGGASLQDVTEAAALCCELGGECDVDGALEEMSAGLLSLGQLVVQLRALQQEKLRNAFPDKSIDHVVAACRSCEVPPPEYVLMAVGHQYEVVNGWAPQLRVLSADAFAAAVQDVRRRCVERPRDEACKLEFLAMCREAIRREFGIFPYSTQCFAVLALLNEHPACRGAVAQVLTGEGKSVIIAMSVALLAAYGNLVDVVCSSDTLAKRDKTRFAKYLKLLGSESGYVDTHAPLPEETVKQVRYGTNTAYEFHLLRSGLDPTQDLTARRGAVAVVDELDNLLLDQATRPAIISGDGEDKNIWVVQPIFQFVDEGVKAGRLLSEPDLRRYLQAHQGGRWKDNLDAISQLTLTKWLVSCHAAITQFEEGEQYAIRVDPEERTNELAVVIVDKGNTGLLNHGSRWEDRQHQFVEMKHGLRVRPDCGRIAEVSRPAFFGNYQALYGLTGTLGGAPEREQLQDVYNLAGFQVAPHNLSIRRHLKSEVVVGDKQAFHARLERSVTAMVKAQRASLVLMESIAATKAFSAYLRTKGIAHRVLNEVQDESGEWIIGQAGRSGAITLATNNAGRGTDIVLSADVKRAKGLHVVVAFYPENQRVESQAFGRAGRQGQPGSTEMVVHCPDPKGAQTLEALTKQREERVKALTSQRRLDITRSEARFVHMDWFFKFLRRVETELDHSCLQELSSRTDVPEPIGRLRMHKATLGRELRQQWMGFLDALDEADLSKLNQPTEHLLADLSGGVLAACAKGVLDGFLKWVNGEFARKVAEK